jgi:very-short-patch-repair endonuclease
LSTNQQSIRNTLTPKAKALRRNPTEAERKLWQRLRARQMEGVKFRRQQPIEDYIVDFVCLKKRLIIEVDGGQHAIERQRDMARDTCLNRNGFKVLRFWNHDVMKNLEGVLETIRKVCLE